MTASQTSSDNSYPRLLGDIGGTNARFALQSAPEAPLSEPRALPCRDYAGPVEAIEAYLAQADLPRPRSAAFGIATALHGDRIEMTNHSWCFSVQETLRGLDVGRLLLVNDFTALALALPVLGEHEVSVIGGGRAVAGSAIGVLGPGTGLGVSGLLPGLGGYLPISGEGGHITLAACNEREAALIAELRRDFAHVSAERVLSGAGLASLHRAICSLDGVANLHQEPPQVLASGLAGSCAQCRETLDVFCSMLGTVAADVALMLGARGGVYIGGGIVQRLGEFFAHSGFRQRFEFKGRFSAYLAGIPTLAITAPWPAMIGAGRALDMDERELGTAIASARAASR